MKRLVILSLKSSFHLDVEYFLFFSFPSTAFRFKVSDQKMNLSKYILQLKERLVTNSTPFFVFHNLVHKW